MIKRIRIETVNTDGTFKSLKPVVFDAGTGEELACVSSVELVNTEQGKGVNLFIADDGQALELDAFSRGMFESFARPRSVEPPSLTYLKEDPERLQAFDAWFINYLSSPRLFIEDEP